MSAIGGMSPLYASMGVNAVSSLATGYSQSQAFKSAGKYQASLSRTNSAMADLAAKQTIEAGDIAASRKNFETRQIVGSELAKQGASGVSVGSGSSAMVRSGENLVGSIDELTIRNNASRAAFGYKIQAIEDRTQAQMAELTGKSQAKQSLLSGGLGAISGPLNIYSNYLMWSRRFGMREGGKVPESYTGIKTSDDSVPQGYLPYSSGNQLSLTGN